MIKSPTPLLTLLIIVLLSGCGSGPNSITSNRADSAAENTNQGFEQLLDSYLDAYWQLHPTSALYAGLYDLDQQLTVPNNETRNQRRQLAEATITKLESFNEESLNQKNRTDRLILLNRLHFSIWSEDVLQDWRWDPSNYNVAGGFGLILNTDYKPLVERLAVFYQRMANVPAYYQAARENISKPTLPHLDLAIQQNQGAISLFQQRFIEQATLAGIDQQILAGYQQRVELVVAAVEQHLVYLRALKEPIQQHEGGEDFRDFRLGKNLFEEKFRRQIVTDFSADEIYRLAIAKKKILHDEMEAITKSLWPAYFSGTTMPADRLQAIAMMITEVAKEHAEPEKFVDEVRQQIAELETFVAEHDLLDLDPSKPLVVREMPEYERGFAVASVDAPGPFAAAANTYFNVSPLDDYDAEGAESFLREYNNRTMQILNIHEAVPGHYAQLVHANKSASLIKSLFGNGAMVEGWAVYAEHMMMEAGYGNGEPELRLMYNKWLLRTVINTIIDHDIHCNNLSESETLALLRDQGFQEEAEAVGKWRRATLSQAQLSSYFTGYSEILAFREELKAKMGDEFNLKQFHHQFLSYGSAPVPIIKQLMSEQLFP